MKYFDTEPGKEHMEGFIYELLRGWHNTLRRYETKYKEMWSKMGGKDLPYVYGEDAHIGLLIIAAERIGGFPFIEFDQEKRTATGTGKQDLEIISSNNQIWNIEAKYLQIRFDDKNLRSGIRKKVREAVSDVRKLVQRRLGRNVGIVFVVPVGVSTDSDCEVFANQIRDVTRSLRNGLSAIHFCRQDIWKVSKHEDCPGVAIVGRYVS